MRRLRFGQATRGGLSPFEDRRRQGEAGREWSLLLAARSFSRHRASRRPGFFRRDVVSALRADAEDRWTAVQGGRAGKSLTCGWSSEQAALAPVDEWGPCERREEVIPREPMNRGAVNDGFFWWAQHVSVKSGHLNHRRPTAGSGAAGAEARANGRMAPRGGRMMRRPRGEKARSGRNGQPFSCSATP